MKKRKIKKTYFKLCVFRNYSHKKYLNLRRSQKRRYLIGGNIRSNFRYWFNYRPKTTFWDAHGLLHFRVVKEEKNTKWPKKTKEWEDTNQLLARWRKEDKKNKAAITCAKCGKTHTKRMRKDWIKRSIKNLPIVGSKYRVFCSEKCYQIYQNIYLKKRGFK